MHNLTDKLADGDNSGIIVFGMLILAIGGAGFMLLRNKSEPESEPEPQVNNIYNTEVVGWYGGPRYNYWWDWGRRYYGRWFRDYDWDDYRRWLGKRHRDDHDVERWLRNRYKAARKNRGGDRHNRDRDDNDKEWWKRAIDWDRDDKWWNKVRGKNDNDRDRDRDNDRDREWNRNDVNWRNNDNNMNPTPTNDDLVVSAAQPITPLDDEDN